MIYLHLPLAVTFPLKYDFLAAELLSYSWAVLCLWCMFTSSGERKIRALYLCGTTKGWDGITWRKFERSCIQSGRPH